jgi:hypothetical protein
MVKPMARFGTVEVTADGEGLVSHAGVALLVELADRVGLTEGMVRSAGRVARASLGAVGLDHHRLPHPFTEEARDQRASGPEDPVHLEQPGTPRVDVGEDRRGPDEIEGVVLECERRIGSTLKAIEGRTEVGLDSLDARTVDIATQKSALWASWRK